MTADRGGSSAITSLGDRVRRARIEENRAAAERLRACYALYRECVREYVSGAGEEARPGYAVIDPFDVSSGQLVESFAVSSGRAEAMISLAVDLSERYPAILEALGEGRLDQRAAELLARQMRTVDPAVLPRVHREVVESYLTTLESGGRPGDAAVRTTVDAIIRAHDADGVRRRKEDASRDRGVHIRKGVDGMSNLWATLAADEAAVLAERLDQRAAEHSETERHSRAERRADALMSLACGEPFGIGAGAGDGSAGDAPVLRPRVSVIASSDGSEPTVCFPRTGESSVHALLAMLSAGSGATLERIDPAIGAADDAGRALGYRPTAALERVVRLRDGTCRHPGCTVAAEYCDLDHVRPFDHADPTRGGPTAEGNLLCLCRRHHRFKTFSDWRYRLTANGAFVVTTGDGKRMVTAPSGPLAAFRREHAGFDREGAGVGRAPRAEPGATPEPTYWHRRAKRGQSERRAVRKDRSRPRDHRPVWNESRRRPGAPTSRLEARIDELLDAPPF